MILYLHYIMPSFSRQYNFKRRRTHCTLYFFPAEKQEAQITFCAVMLTSTENIAVSQTV
ncbi:hypothetical protein CLOHYLEM_04869 [[Clostridium] hylemonae DSM 15053]|uniref:Uncharacterized protein n=1 Tax=[Clostridium] hylemonae DSM 15053 TaxID=553973 RepID=C0BYI0_9FIRM|nr:hypothetical protein CLOHYLEM_04869 [[Clostridium] hylemonae DSM 15053]